MMGICINRGLIGDSRIQKAILDKGLRILIRDEHDFDFYLLHKEQLSGSMTEIENYHKQQPELTLYEDEPINTPEVWKTMYKKYPNCIIGELTDRAFEQLSNLITYTCYRKIISIFGWRIQIPFTNQLSTWKHIQKTYLNKFPIVWIKFGQSKKLNEWAIQNGKDIWYYTEESDINKLLNQIKGIQ